MKWTKTEPLQLNPKISWNCKESQRIVKKCEMISHFSGKRGTCPDPLWRRPITTAHIKCHSHRLPSSSGFHWPLERPAVNTLLTSHHTTNPQGTRLIINQSSPLITRSIQSTNRSASDRLIIGAVWLSCSWVEVKSVEWVDFELQSNQFDWNFCVGVNLERR